VTGRCALVAKEYVKVEDQVRDVMLLTLPGLKADGEDISVDPDFLMEDDGMDGAFFEAFIRDEVPMMEMRHEARDLTIPEEPSVAACEEAQAGETPETADAVLAIAPVQSAPAIAPAAAPLAIGAAEPCEALTAPVTMALPVPEEVPAIAEAAPVEEPVAEVPQAPRIWRVCFSF